MNDKKVICLILFLFLSSAGMLTPVALPYFTLEREQVSQQSLNPSAGPLELKNHSDQVLAQTKRNVQRLERAQAFGRWFVVSFTVFTMSSLLLCGLLLQFLIKRLLKRSPHKA